MDPSSFEAKWTFDSNVHKKPYVACASQKSSPCNCLLSTLFDFSSSSSSSSPTDFNSVNSFIYSTTFITTITIVLNWINIYIELEWNLWRNRFLIKWNKKCVWTILQEKLLLSYLFSGRRAPHNAPWFLLLACYTRDRRTLSLILIKLAASWSKSFFIV